MTPSQFNINEGLGYSPISLDVIDISSESGEAFTVEAGNDALIEKDLGSTPLGPI